MNSRRLVSLPSLAILVLVVAGCGSSSTTTVGSPSPTAAAGSTTRSTSSDPSTPAATTDTTAATSTLGIDGATLVLTVADLGGYTLKQSGGLAGVPGYQTLFQGSDTTTFVSIASIAVIQDSAANAALAFTGGKTRVEAETQAKVLSTTTTLGQATEVVSFFAGVNQTVVLWTEGKVFCDLDVGFSATAPPLPELTRLAAAQDAKVKAAQGL